jgi:endonuclease YncB( thermonuclease family)
MNKLTVFLFVLFSFFVFASRIDAHPGRTDSSGGHTCRTNCESWGLGYGEYHYHGGGSSGTTGQSTYTAPAMESAPPEANQKFMEYRKAVLSSVPTKSPTRIPTKIPTPTKYIESENDKNKLFKVVSIIDGDTIDVMIRGKAERVRLLAIDTPETKDPRKPVQCFGNEATKKMQSFVSGKYVRLVDDRSQGNRDKYSRLLRYVYEDKTFINREMVAQGYAFSYKQYPTKYLNEFNKLEQQAREKNLGLWNKCQ